MLTISGWNTWRCLGAVLFLVACQSPVVPAQETVQAISTAQRAAFTADPSRILASEQARAENRAALDAGLRQMEDLKGHVTDRASNLYRYVTLFETVNRTMRKELVLLRLRYSVDRTDVRSLDALNSLVAGVNSRLAFGTDELRALTSQRLDRLIKDEPRLGAYRFWLAPARPLKSQPLSGAERQILARLEPLTTGWVAEHYNQVGRPPENQGFESVENEVAFGLRHLTKAANEAALIRGYRVASERAYADAYLTLQQVDSWLKAVAAQAEVHKRYETARIGQLRTLTGKDTLDYYRDYLGTPPGTPNPRFDIGTAAALIQESIGPLGSVYSDEMAKLLNPANRRLDLIGDKPRVSGAFALGFPGSVESILYMQAFEGTFSNLVVMAHESSHAVHTELMSGSKVSPLFAQGPDYLTESFAQFAELLVIDRLIDRTSDPSLRRFYEEQFLQRTLHEVFAQARAVDFENRMYDMSNASGLNGAPDLNRLMRDVGSRYSLWFGREDETMRDWVQVPHFSRNPFYRINYLIGRVLALKYYQLYRADPSGFATSYVRLLQAGYNAPPSVLLSRFLQIDLSDGPLITSALQLLGARVDRLVGGSR
jgi:oligoendopeptidase F